VKDTIGDVAAQMMALAAQPEPAQSESASSPQANATPTELPSSPVEPPANVTP